MTEAELVVLYAELAGSHCELNHGPGVDCKEFKAVCYLTTHIGKKVDNVRSEIVRTMNIPICQECLDALAGEEWTLAFCVECSSSQWIARKFAKLKYRHNVLRLKGCPNCGIYGGIWF